MLSEARKRGVELLERVPLGWRRRRRSAALGLLQRRYAAQSVQRIVVAVLELARAVDRPKTKHPPPKVEVFSE